VNIVVLTKFVPERAGHPPEIGPEFRLRRESGDGGLDCVDEPGLAIARRLADAVDGTVTALSMGPELAVSALLRALATGADRAILVTDGAISGADALATARVLACAIAREPYDLVIAGVESSDGSTGTMPMALAQLLDIPSATFARRLLLNNRNVEIERQTAVGYDAIECPLPALVTVTAGVAEPRYPSAKQMIQARRKPMVRWSLADLGIDPKLAVPTQEVTAIEFGLERQSGDLVEDPAQAPARVLRLLTKAKVV
jgi:electron transfer flavoprotein beta subunit